MPGIKQLLSKIKKNKNKIKIFWYIISIMSSANYLNTNSNSNGKTVASEGSRVNIEGYKEILVRQFFFIITQAKSKIPN